MKNNNSLPENKGNKTGLRIADIVWIASIVAITLVMLELFHRMIINYNGKYESDVQYYVTENVTSGVAHNRLLNIIFQFFYDLNQGTLEANIYLALVIALIIIANYVAIRYFLQKDNMLEYVPRHAIQFFSVAMLFIGPLYVPVLHEYYYRRSFSSFAWHSPTQQSMTLFAIIAMICFINMHQKAEEGRLSAGAWLASMISTLIATMYKPSYTLCVMGAIMILGVIDLIKKDDFKKQLIKWIFIGCSVIPSGLYMIWLHNTEFSESAQFGEEHKVIFDISHVINYERLWAAILFGISFPIVVYLINHEKFKDFKYKFVLVVFLVGVLQWAVLTETGTRGNFGNFTWGRIVGSYLLTLSSVVVALEYYYSDRSSETNKKRRVALIIMAIVLTWSILSQLNYLRLICTGHYYLR